MTSRLLSSYDGHIRNLKYAGRTVRMLLVVRKETEVHFLVGTVILGFLSICKKSQALSPFEALKFRVPLEVSKGCDSPCPDQAETYGFL